jgi:hypothetical protein
VTNLNVDDHFLRLFEWTPADLAARGIGNDASWVEVVVRMIVAGSDAERLLPIALDAHARISLAMAAHIKGVASNLRRSFWLSAGMLNKDPVRAQVVLGSTFVSMRHHSNQNQSDLQS